MRKLLPRDQTRHVDSVVYNQRVRAANTLLKEQCKLKGLVYWRKREFTNRETNIVADVFISNIFSTTDRDFPFTDLLIVFIA